MEEQARKMTIVGAMVTVAAMLFVGTIVRATLYAPDPEFQLAFLEPTRVHASVAAPERLVIPMLEVDAAVERVGINARGDMAAPSNYTRVGWYKYGVRPGEVGSAVIAGHLDNGLGLNGVFKGLDDLQIGDDIFIETEKGETLLFVVSEVASYLYNDVPVQKLFNRDDKAYLALVTCDGRWVRSAKTYGERLVVYAELVE